MKIRSPLPHRKARIEIIPLIDIMFFLLASFMLVSLTMSKQQSIPVNLPTATQARREFKPDLVALAVDRTGDVWLEKQRLSLEELHQALLARLAANTNLPVYISGDKDTPHGRMVFVRLSLTRLCVTSSDSRSLHRCPHPDCTRDTRAIEAVQMRFA